MKNKEKNLSFGILFFIVFALIAFWPFLSGEKIRLWAILISFIFLILGVLNSQLLTPLKKIWIKIGIILGKIIAPLVMALIYFIIITPISIIIKISGKDILNMKFDSSKSYWIKRTKQLHSMKKQF